MRLPLTVALSLLLTVAGAVEVWAKPNPAGCRSAIGRNGLRVARVGMKTIDGCHRNRSAGAGGAACNVLPVQANSDFGRSGARFDAAVTFKCPVDDTSTAGVRDNYPGGAIGDTVDQGVRRLLEDNADLILQDVVVAGAGARCRQQIANGRRRVTQSILERATKCQRRLDKSGRSDFGPVDPTCLTAAPAAGRRVEKRIARACAGLTGSAVGSCDPLPDCVIATSEDLGLSLARLTYGDAASCGNGVVDFGEECDDGNAVDTDACRSNCVAATCRDGVVWEGVEECDDGNAEPLDGCDNECRLPVCGDGIVNGSEQCDDGNDVPDDGCTECAFDPVPCGAGGIRALVTLSVPGGQPLGGGTMDVRYPDGVELPGSGRTPELRTRVRNVSGADGLLSAQSDDDTDGDGVDDTVRIAFASTTEWPAGDFAEIDFDCEQGAEVLGPSIICRLIEASDPFQNAICGDGGVGGVAACDDESATARVQCTVAGLSTLP